MPAARKEILKPKVEIILTITKLSFASSIRAEHTIQPSTQGRKTNIAQATFKISREMLALS